MHPVQDPAGDRSPSPESDPPTVNRVLTPARSLSLLLILVAPGLAQRPEIPKDVGPIVTTLSGLRYSVLAKGPEKEDAPRPGNKVLFHYAGWLKDGTLVETSLGGKVRQMILGVAMPQAWTEGMQQMRPGARVKFMVPSELAYGKVGTPGRPPAVPGVPPNADMVFEIELVGVESGVELPTFLLADPAQEKQTESGLKYVVRKPGAGERPQRGERFTVSFDWFNERGMLVSSTCLDQDNRIIGRMGRDLPGPAFLAEAVAMMRVGSEYRFEVPASLTHGEEGRGYLLPPNSKSTWVLRMERLDPAPEPRSVPKFSRLKTGEIRITASGLRYQVIEPGKGALPKADELVEIHYAGWLSSQRVFDETFTHGAPLDVDLGRREKFDLVPGLREGLALMRPGAIYRFVLPPRLGYGLRGRKDLKIGPNRRLYFYVEMVGIRQPLR